MITQRPSHMRMCDRLVLLDRGSIIAVGTPEEVLAKSIPASDQPIKELTS
jgi:ABC-type multidrug transport system fused ATPase/permease subunit